MSTPSIRAGRADGAAVDRSAIRDGYLRALEANGADPAAFAFIDDEARIRARIRDVQAALAGHGVSDVTNEGRLILGGVVNCGPGIRRGVDGLPAMSTSLPLDIDLVPAFYEYTRKGVQAQGSPLDLVGRRFKAAPDRTRAVTRPGYAQPVATMDTGSHGSIVDRTLGTIDRRLDTGRALVMNQSPMLLIDEFILVADDLQLQDGTVLVIANGVKYVTILARNLTVGADVWIEWEAATMADRAPRENVKVAEPSYDWSTETSDSAYRSPAGGDGGHGHLGHVGLIGDPAPSLDLWALTINALPEIQLMGGQGGRGGRGGAGGAGGHGAKGASAEGNIVSCVQEPGFGGDGGRGGDGGSGGDGGAGGRGGDLSLFFPDDAHEAALAAGLKDNRAGGRGGDGGEGGSWGLGGTGGLAGDPSFPYCKARPERAGASFRLGDPGEAGTNGVVGDTGLLSALVITESEFLTKWTAPQIRRVEPRAVRPRDTVTVTGANYTPDAVVHFAGTPASTTYIGDTVLQATVPLVPAGWTEITVEIPGGETSNRAAVQVLTSISSVSPSPTTVGTTLTIIGSGFATECTVLFRAHELTPDEISASGTLLRVTLPAPPPPFEDFGGVEELVVRNPDGVTSNPMELVLRRVLDTGFDVDRHAYSFLNAGVSGVADLGTFEQTYGTLEVAAMFALAPVVTGAWFAFYLKYFNDVRPGYSSGFSMTAIDEYWSGNPDLSNDHQSLADVEDLLTVAQGHILSMEMLTTLAAQAANRAANAEDALARVESAFREQLNASNTRRREIAPVMQLVPAGTILAGGFLPKLRQSHGLLPIRVEYPVEGDTWERRLVLYDNARRVGTESRAVFTRNGSRLDFQIEHLDEAGQVEVPPDPRDSATDWTLTAVSLEECWLQDVTMPVDFVVLMSPAAVFIEDEDGRRFGTDGTRYWDDIPHVVPGPGVGQLYLLPLAGRRRFTVHGIGRGTYDLAIVSRSRGRSVVLRDVPVDRDTRDIVLVARDLTEVTVVSAEESKRIDLVYGIEADHKARGLVMTGLEVGRNQPFSLASDAALRTFAVRGRKTEGAVTLDLVATNAQAAARQRFDDVALGPDQRRFRVDDWDHLDSESLQPAPH